jgi:hypothetical protein
MKTMIMAQVEEWLAGIPAKQTGKSYKDSVRKSEEWLGKPIESLLGNPDEATKAIERFFCYLKEKFCQNTARNQTNGVIQYFKAHNTEVKPRRALNIYHTIMTVCDHTLSIAEIQQMARHADLREQVLLKIRYFVHPTDNENVGKLFNAIESLDEVFLEHYP